MAAKQSALVKLHEMLAEQMVLELQWYRDNDIPVPAADKAAIAKFLKDNSITCDPADASDLEELRKKFEEEGKARRMNAMRALEASEEDLRNQYGLQ